MSEVGRLARHSSLFFASNVLIVLAGAVSLPVWTRLLTQEQYGLFALYNVTITFMISVCKFGMQHASLRFYSEVEAGKLGVGLTSYYTTMVLGGLCISIPVVAVSMGAAHWLLKGEEALWVLVVPVGAAILAQSTANLLLMFLRVEQHVKLQAVLLVVQRYSRLGAGLLLVSLFGITVANIFWGFVLSGALLCLGLLVRLVRQGKIAPREFSARLLKDAVAYGFPLGDLEGRPDAG
jgi:O-antigen/teichoic acid export membrane protein